jgi:hypothetical protein
MGRIHVTTKSGEAIKAQKEKEKVERNVKLLQELMGLKQIKDAEIVIELANNDRYKSSFVIKEGKLYYQSSSFDYDCKDWDDNEYEVEISELGTEKGYLRYLQNYIDPEELEKAYRKVADS